MNDKKQIRDIKEILDFLFEIYSRDKNKNRRAIGLINTLSEELLEFQNDTYWKTDTER